ncbi:ADP-ribosylglycohydrolase family protein [Pseudoduganella sp. DS3]|uniref:ADP-ribosylglycohydrolase family protein n=1 Tax=Pseudoduganella guangdongensis TaxID=2692179 RepID=A0A6N9HN93_9BURK|nr:ADP-ribosylglycohydrolase family protein [Pseudoduganella guangdongensis]MYN04737.1 ADP-ribosylglycohydrolase family protein [Pseudoduganella guangdongensis]
MIPTLEERYRGCLLGLACGDAVGTTVEFMPRGSFVPVKDMRGGGPFGLAPGQWTDDTSMALCLAESLLTKGGFDAHDQMARYLNWWQWGYLSSTGECFDIGMTVRQALSRFQANGDPFAGSSDPQSAGNGSLMRLAPVALFFHPSESDVLEFSALSSRTTHAASEAVECCRLFGLLLSRALQGMPRDALLDVGAAGFAEVKVAQLADRAYAGKGIGDVTGSGYCVASLEAALWCFAKHDDLESTILAAANLGDDADTTAAIVGQLAGAYYGARHIPAAWLDQLHMRDDIESMASALLRRAAERH